MTTATRPSSSKRSTATPGAAASRRQTYFQASRSPRYSVLFALPLLLGYEGLLAALSQSGTPQVVNGADALLRGAFTAVLGARGPMILIAAIILGGVWLVARDIKRTGDRPRLVVFAGMIVEAVALAAAFGFIIGLTTAKLLGSLHTLSLGPVTQTTWPTRLMLSLGAGLFEELFFRVLLVGGIAAGARLLLGLGRRMSGAIAAVASALIFAAFHYIGPYGDQLQLQSFVFRAISGLAFSLLYLTRGFGITAWTHTLYDAFLLLG
jgi:membrane protease YdiL (CAAX protease family)